MHTFLPVFQMPISTAIANEARSNKEETVLFHLFHLQTYKPPQENVLSSKFHHADVLIHF